MRDLAGRLGKGGIAALLALAVLLAVIGYRIFTAPDDPAAIATAGSGPIADISLEELEQQAANNPDDPLAWQRLGFAYFDLGRFANSAAAYEKAVAADPDNAVLWASLGEARVMASTTDPLPQAAMDAFRRAAELDASEPRTRYFLAVAKDLADDHAGAIADWLALLADTPPGAPWENDLVRTIQQVGTIRGIAVEDRIAQAAASRNILPQSMVSGIPGPSQEQLAAAAALSPGQQQDMAEGMVERLAARLEADPVNVEGWIMLMRSYVTLGQGADAQAALARAVAANPGSADQLRSAARSLGVE